MIFLILKKNEKRLNTEKQKLKKDFREKKKWSPVLVLLKNWAEEKIRNL